MIHFFECVLPEAQPGYAQFHLKAPELHELHTLIPKLLDNMCGALILDDGFTCK